MAKKSTKKKAAGKKAARKKTATRKGPFQPTAKQHHALSVVRTFKNGCTPREFAEKAWPNSQAWKKSMPAGKAGTNQGGGVVLSAGAALGKLKSAKLVKDVATSKERGSRYKLTSQGERAYQRGPKA